MRRVQLGLWTAGLLVAATAPAWAQAIIEPEVSGRTIPISVTTGTFRQKVYTTGDVSVHLRVFHGLTQKFAARATVLTCGPTILVTSDVPLGSFRLAPGDLITFVFTVKHLNGCDAGTGTLMTSVIPVVGPCAAPPETTRVGSSIPAKGEVTRAPPARRREDDARVG